MMIILRNYYIDFIDLFFQKVEQNSIFYETIGYIYFINRFDNQELLIFVFPL